MLIYWKNGTHTEKIEDILSNLKSQMIKENEYKDKTLIFENVSILSNEDTQGEELMIVFIKI